MGVAHPSVVVAGVAEVTASIGVALSFAAHERPENVLRRALKAGNRARELGGARIEISAEAPSPTISRRRVHGRARAWRVVAPLPADRELRDRAGRGVRVARFVGTIPTAGCCCRPSSCPTPSAPARSSTSGPGRSSRRAARWPSGTAPRARPSSSTSTSPAASSPSPMFPAQVKRVIGETGLAPGAVWLEITEDTLAQDREAADHALRQLHEIGVRLVVDDFGTGASSLVSLKRVPVRRDQDRPRVHRRPRPQPRERRDLQCDHRARPLARLCAIAEGVETLEQYAALRALGCELGQGHLFGPARPARRTTRRRPRRSASSSRRAPESKRACNRARRYPACWCVPRSGRSRSRSSRPSRSASTHSGAAACRGRRERCDRLAPLWPRLRVRHARGPDRLRRTRRPDARPRGGACAAARSRAAHRVARGQPRRARRARDVVPQERRRPRCRASCATGSTSSRSTRAASATAARSTCATDIDPLFDEDFSPGRRCRAGAAGRSIPHGRRRVRPDERHAPPARVDRRHRTRPRPAPRRTRRPRSSRTSASRTARISGRSTRTLFPSRVRALVLDGAIDPGADGAAVALGQARGFERALDDFLADCAERRRLRVPPVPEATAVRPARHTTRCGRAAARRADPGTIEPRPHRERDAARRRRARVAVRGPGRLDEPRATRWPTRSRATRRRCSRMADGFVGRGASGDRARRARRVLGDQLSRRPDRRRRRTRPRASRPGASAVAPRLGAFLVNFSLACSIWPVPPVTAPTALDAAGAPPLLVVGTTDDPATPLVSAAALARSARPGALLVAEGEQHTSFARRERVRRPRGHALPRRPRAPAPRAPAADGSRRGLNGSACGASRSARRAIGAPTRRSHP